MNRVFRNLPWADVEEVNWRVIHCLPDIWALSMRRAEGVWRKGDGGETGGEQTV